MFKQVKAYQNRSDHIFVSTEPGSGSSSMSI